MGNDTIDRVRMGDKVYNFRDTQSGYVTKNVEGLTNYTDNTNLTTLMAEKANVADVPVAGQIAEGDTGYATGDAVYQLLGDLSEE